jgi:hypothetical protein
MLVRVIATASSLLSTATMLAGCAQQPAESTRSVDSETAKRQMIDAVDDATEQLGGDWEARTGPDYAESCQLPGGEEGAHWVYLTGRIDGSSPTGPELDASATTDRWKEQGMTVERWSDPDGPVLVGRGGGSISSISLYAFPGNSTVEALSLCFPGDPDVLSLTDDE